MLLIGPAVTLVFSTGKCTFNKTEALLGTRELKCKEPSIIYNKEPAVFTSHYKSGAVFTTAVSLSKLFKNVNARLGVPMLTSSVQLKARIWCVLGPGTIV